MGGNALNSEFTEENGPSYVCGSFFVLTTCLRGQLVCLSWTGLCFGGIFGIFWDKTATKLAH